MFIEILLTLIFYFIITFLSVNLLGLFVRGLFTNSEILRLKKEGTEFIKNEINKSERIEKRINLMMFILILIYLFVLFYFWNIGVSLTAIILMVSRLPDLLWEIKNGKKITINEARKLPKDLNYYISFTLTILALPMLYYFLYHF